MESEESAVAREFGWVVETCSSSCKVHPPTKTTLPTLSSFVNCTRLPAGIGACLRWKSEALALTVNWDRGSVNHPCIFAA